MVEQRAKLYKLSGGSFVVQGLGVIRLKRKTEGDDTKRRLLMRGEGGGNILLVSHRCSQEDTHVKVADHSVCPEHGDQGRLCAYGRRDAGQVPRLRSHRKPFTVLPQGQDGGDGPSVCRCGQKGGPVIISGSFYGMATGHCRTVGLLAMPRHVLL